MSEVKFKCPSCGQPVEMEEAESNRGLNCPSCYKFFTPKFSKSGANEILPGSVDKNDFIRERKAANRVEQIRTKAQICTTLAKISFFIGLAILVISPFLNEDHITIGIAFGASFIGTAFWLFLLAQLIYIRANTEK